jgi:hypothetical protein
MRTLYFGVKPMSPKTKHDANNNKIVEFSQWDTVINSELIQLQELEAQAARLRVSIEYFEKRKGSGAPFPGQDKLKEAGLL